MILLLRYWKYLAGLLVVAALFGAGAHWQAGRDERKAAAVAALQAQRDAIAAAAFAKAVQERDDAEKAAAAANRRIYAELEPKLAAATADARHFARLLHDALAAEPRGGAVPEAADQPAAPDATGARSDGPITAATADALAECKRNELRLGALQAEVLGQM